MSNTDERDDKIRELIYDLQRERDFDNRGYKLMNKIIKFGNGLTFKIP